MSYGKLVLKRAIAIAFSFTALSACIGPVGELNRILGEDVIAGPQGIIPPNGVNPVRGTGCGNDDPNHICLAVKYVAFKDSAGTPAISETQAKDVVSNMNNLWRQCDISFTLEKYQPVKPADHGLAYQIANLSDLTQVRESFSEDHLLLVATTGTWNRSGTLGKTGANAWTSMPNGGPYGVVIEKPVGTNSNLVAHEMGHYLNLLHLNDSNALMNPIIYAKSNAIYSNECETARSAALYFWPRMIR